MSAPSTPSAPAAPSAAPSPVSAASAAGPDAARGSAARTYALDRAHVFHSWSAQAEISPMVVTAAEGSHVVDGEGNRLLDFSSQLVNTNIGHQHPDVVAAIADQAHRLATIAPQYANDQRSEAARLIAERTPGALDRIFFTNGGADANEHAVRMARLTTGRPKVLTRYRSYHGGTDTAINLTGDPRRWANDGAAAGVVHFFGPYLYRSRFHATTEAEECERALEHLEQVVQLEGPQTIAAVLLEAIPGTAGIMVPPPGYLAGVRELCDRYGILLVVDEVMTGFGRTGAWFVSADEGVVPDLLTFAKGVNSGYVPLGGVAVGPRVDEHFAHRPYPGGLTYSGHPLACAAAVATLEVMERDDVNGHARRLGEQVIGPELRALAERHPTVGEVRGRGVFWAVELVTDKGSRTPVAPTGGSSSVMAGAVQQAKALGLLPFTNSNRIHVVPPCTVSEAEAREGLAVLDKVLDRVDELVAETA
ncbi:aspartate aminotransferase family protein [Streptomyces cacaoi]|uniref:Aspartate aminotransferase family protein n=2 Tax=Streptomyces cacaoi TaxID=1898 RepID=A0A4Y3QYW1_STRCI|nr:aspartate aminotransferase family protein [Streptomyces cacaoi]NNG88932.1 aspartate aminotransferase family protein [Streptomyces cacaoi]GEB49827.1 aspartate aminotransferase family protein [Streptomyces cacaoi]